MIESKSNNFQTRKLILKCQPFCLGLYLLTHWGQVMHIYVSNLTIIGSDNGLSPCRRQAIIWTKAGILLIGALGSNFSGILTQIHTFSFKEMHFKMSSGKRQPFCLGLYVLNVCTRCPQTVRARCDKFFLWVQSLIKDLHFSFLCSIQYPIYSIFYCQTYWNMFSWNFHDNGNIQVVKLHKTWYHFFLKFVMFRWSQ